MTTNLNRQQFLAQNTPVVGSYDDLPDPAPWPQFQLVHTGKRTHVVHPEAPHKMACGMASGVEHSPGGKSQTSKHTTSWTNNPKNISCANCKKRIEKSRWF